MLNFTKEQLKILSRGQAFPSSYLVIGGPLHGTIQAWDHDVIITRSPRKLDLSKYWMDDLTIGKAQEDKYIETRCWDEHAIDGQGDHAVCRLYLHESINFDGLNMRMIPFMCWLLGIGYRRQEGFFKVVGKDRWCTYEVGDKWAVYAGLAYYDVSKELARLEFDVDQIVKGRSW